MTGEKWYVTEGFMTRKGKMGVLFYLAKDKIYSKHDVELSPSPWVHPEFFNDGKEIFFSSRDIAHGEILKEIEKVK